MERVTISDLVKFYSEIFINNNGDTKSVIEYFNLIFNFDNNINSDTIIYDGGSKMSFHVDPSNENVKVSIDNCMYASSIIIRIYNDNVGYYSITFSSSHISDKINIYVCSAHIDAFKMAESILKEINISKYIKIKVSY